MSMTKQLQAKLYSLPDLIFNMLLKYILRSRHRPKIVDGVAIILVSVWKLEWSSSAWIVVEQDGFHTEFLCRL